MRIDVQITYSKLWFVLNTVALAVASAGKST